MDGRPHGGGFVHHGGGGFVHPGGHFGRREFGFHDFRRPFFGPRFVGSPFFSREAFIQPDIDVVVPQTTVVVGDPCGEFAARGDWVGYDICRRSYGYGDVY